MRPLVLLLFAVGCYHPTAGEAPVDAPVDGESPDAGADAPLAGCILDLAVGGNHTCAVTTDHAVWCWGSGEGGVLANASTVMGPHTRPLAVEGLAIAADRVSLGHYLSTAWSDADGVVYAWGRNGDHEVDASSDDPATPRRVPTLPAVQGLDAGYYFACALTGGSSLACWGDNDWGQLGRGAISDEEAVGVTAPSAGVVATGEDYACAVLDGSVSCWGRNLQGRLGESEGASLLCTSNDGVSGRCRMAPHRVGLDAAVTVSAGGEHACAVNAEGTVFCWGANSQGQLGDGTMAPSSTPAAVAIPGSVVEVAAGNQHSCALLADGTVRCWGDNVLGQLGNGTRNDAQEPVEVNDLRGVVHLSCDSKSDHTCALRADGTAVCWGENNDGEIGVGSEETQDVPVEPLLPCP